MVLDDNYADLCIWKILLEERGGRLSTPGITVEGVTNNKAQFQCWWDGVLSVNVILPCYTKDRVNIQKRLTPQQAIHLQILSQSGDDVWVKHSSKGVMYLKKAEWNIQ